MCEVLRVSRSGYYDWRRRQGTESTREAANRVLICLAEFVYCSEDARGRKAGQPEVSAWPRTTVSDPRLPTSENVLGRVFVAEAFDMKWAADMTYIPTGKGLIHHDDQDCQYASEDRQEILAGPPILGSMSRRGKCLDNAPVESFFSALKPEARSRPSAPIPDPFGSETGSFFPASRCFITENVPTQRSEMSVRWILRHGITPPERSLWRLKGDQQHPQTRPF